MTIEKIRMRKESNDKAKILNTYLIRTTTKKGNLCDWYADELCFVRKVLSDHVLVFRPFDGKQYKIKSDEVKHFKLI